MPRRRDARPKALFTNKFLAKIACIATKIPSKIRFSAQISHSEYPFTTILLPTNLFALRARPAHNNKAPPPSRETGPDCSLCYRSATSLLFSPPVWQQISLPACPPPATPPSWHVPSWSGSRPPPPRTRSGCGSCPRPCPCRR